MTIDLNLVVPVLAVAVGWLLNEFSHWFRLRREDKGAVGNLLISLAEVRHRLTVTNLYLERIAKKIPAVAEERLTARLIMDNVLNSLDGLDVHYDEAIHKLACRDPDLAFRLHAKNRLPSFLTETRQLMSIEPVAAEQFDKLERYLTKQILPALDEAIVELARLHSFRARHQFKKRVAEWKDHKTMTKEMDRMIREMVRLAGG